MIDITRLYCAESTPGDPIRYGWRDSRNSPMGSALDRRPVVVWNLTRTCNLKCLHCYSDSEAKKYSGELTTQEAFRVIEDLARFKIPALLMSGGEPLTRPDLFDLAREAGRLGLRVTLSTNGTLIDMDKAKKIRDAGFIYVGVSLDGIGEIHDHFRGVPGSFERTLQGIRHCKSVGQKVGLRLTMTRHTIRSLPEILNLMITEKIDRACFYHLVFTGRGRFLSDEALSRREARASLEEIMKWTRAFHLFGLKKEILTVGNPVDGVFVYLKLQEEHRPDKAQQVLDLISSNGGGMFGSGVGLGCIDFSGNVHPDQFWMQTSLGNVKERPFSAIWQDFSNPLLRGLKNRIGLLAGRCGHCRWKTQCGGGLRTRAFLASHDPWSDDPGCYLADAEILSPGSMAPQLG